MSDVENFDLFMNMVDACKSGVAFDFYGVDGNRFCLGEHPNRVVFEAVEDESDGYRSYLETIRVDNAVSPSECGIFFRKPLDRVRIVTYELSMSDDMDKESGYQLVSAMDGHVWLSIGTNAYDDYYPCFVFNYRPREPN